MREFAALFRKDIYLNKLAITLGILATVAAPIANRFGLMDSRASLIVGLGAGILILPMMLPNWFVGSERILGTVRLLVRLPISKLQLALYKHSAMVIISLSASLIGALSVTLFGLIQAVHISDFALIFICVAISVNAVCTGLHFLFPTRYVSAVLFAIVIGTSGPVKAWLATAQLPSMLPIDFAAAALVLLCEGFLAISVTAWSRRSNPC